MWGDTNKAVFTHLEGGNDSGIELLYVFDKNKKLQGIVANLACPAQCVQHRLFISPDFWGETKMLLRKHFGEDIFLLPLCSAAGDQCPVDLVRWVEPYTDVNDPNLKRNNPPKRKADPSMFDLDGMRKAGKRIANEIIEVYEDGIDEPTADAVFEHEVHDMKLPLRRATLADEAMSKREIRAYLANKTGDVDYNDVANLHVYTGLLQRLELQDKLDKLSENTPTTYWLADGVHPTHSGHQLIKNEWIKAFDKIRKS
jgi:lysophospholipase L1-like esterase